MKWFRKWLRSIPHLFGKLMVVWCVAAGTLCSLWALRILSRTGQDASALLAPILAFFGGELALMFGKNALQSKKNKEE
ncbi:MAG: hypothetical protein J6A62_02325 [Oscillospiraceae bacterium]|nr:hypothetical protein [Oscillospiraceae bacterium]